MRVRARVIASIWALGAAAAVWAQPAPAAPETDRGAAYYHYSMGHIFTELAREHRGQQEYLNQAIDHLREALAADPSAGFIAEELADIYLQANRLTEGIRDAENAVRDNPNNVNAHRILGRIYMRLIGDTQRGRINEQYLKLATGHFSRITVLQPDDVDSWMTLGQLHRVGRDSVEAEKAFQKVLELEPENEDAMTGLALVYSDLGDTTRATSLLRRIAERNPNLQTLTSLAGSYEQMREYGLAADVLRRALALSPDNTDLKRALAQDLMLAEQLDEALEIYRQLAAEDPKDETAFLRMSQIWRQKRNFAEARKASDQAKRLAPDNLEVLYNEVGIHEAEGKIPEAIQALKNILDATAKRSYTAGERNNRALLLERLGMFYRDQERYEDAASVFRELGLLDPGLAARASAQVIDTYRRAMQYERAAAEADAALQKWPEDRTIRSVRATVMADRGNVEGAVAEMRKMLGGGSDRETWLGIAQLYERAKRYPEMGKALDEGEKLSATDEDKEVIFFMRGAMYERMKDVARSEEQFRKVLALNPDSASALNYLGYMLADNNMRLNEALEMIQKAVDQEPDNGAYLDSLGWVYFRLGRIREAEDYLLRALEREPKDPTINDHLGDVYAKQGNLKEAVAVWERALKLWSETPPAQQDPAEIAKIQKKVESARVALAKMKQN